jgi:hypothetical protein
MQNQHLEKIYVQNAQRVTLTYFKINAFHVLKDAKVVIIVIKY